MILGPSALQVSCSLPSSVSVKHDPPADSGQAMVAPVEEWPEMAEGQLYAGSDGDAVMLT